MNRKNKSNRGYSGGGCCQNLMSGSNILIICWLWSMAFLGCHTKSPGTDWPEYKAGAGSSSYSPLRQINRQNVDQLQVAWTYRTGDLPEGSYSTMETNPIVVDGILYGASPQLKVFALDAATGAERWTFDPFKNERGRGYLRAVTYWGEGEDQRILFAAGHYLFALDAATGQPIPGFGQNGRVDLNKGLGRDPATISVKSPSPGIMYRDLIIMGSATGEGYESAPGHIRAYKVQTGDLAWTFRTIPRPGAPGYQTWTAADGGQIQKGGVNNWAGMSLDRRRGIVYVPLGSPTYDFWGGDRPGKNLFGNTLLALNAATGEHIWHYQTVHHDLWDYDLPAPPNLVTLKRKGREVDAVAQVSKTGFTFVLNRQTGEPLFDIEERPVARSQIPSEQAWPTQPVPAAPEPFVRQHISRQDLARRSPVVADSVRVQFARYRYEGLFTPPDPRGSVVFPSTRGGANWGGAAYDPKTDLLYINANETPEISTVKLVAREPAAEATPYEQGKQFYRQHCVSCHGAELEGQPPMYPALRQIEKTKSRAQVKTMIRKGGGRMPGFPAISEVQIKALLAFLFEKEKAARSIHASGRARPEAGGIGEGQYINLTAYSQWEAPDGLPAITPPWGTLNAINLQTGKIQWRVPLGDYPEAPGKHPTGMESWGGPIVTAGGLIFIGGTRDKQFRAFDKATGQLLWSATLPTGGFATPTTYMAGGRQYVVIAAGGGRGTKPGDYYIAFALPSTTL